MCNDKTALCSQVVGDHQHSGRTDLGSGPSQPGQEAVGPGRGLGLPGLLQPQQTRGETRLRGKRLTQKGK